MRSLNLYAGETVKINPGQTKIVPMCLENAALYKKSKVGKKQVFDIDLYNRAGEKRSLLIFRLVGKISWYKLHLQSCQKVLYYLLLLTILTKNGRLINPK